MIVKVAIFVVLIAALSFSLYLLYQNLPGTPQNFNVNFSSTANSQEENITYPETPVFYPNLRFNHNSLSYKFNNCDDDKRQGVLNAMQTLMEKTKLSFFSKADDEDITIDCSGIDTSTYNTPFIAGEGGPTRIIETGLYNVILNGKILLYNVSSCRGNVELHEILHVLGFNHSENPRNILYKVSSCNQEISEDVISTLNQLYSIKPLPDLYFANLTASKNGRYLNFYVEVRNQGMISSGNASLIIFSGNNQIEEFQLGDLDFGSGKILNAQNVALPSRDTSSAKFVIKLNNNGEEISVINNEAELTLA